MEECQPEEWVRTAAASSEVEVAMSPVPSLVMAWVVGPCADRFCLAQRLALMRVVGRRRMYPLVSSSVASVPAVVRRPL